MELPGNFNVKAAVAVPLAASLGVLAGVAVGLQPKTSATAQGSYIESCLSDYASLDNHHALTAEVRGSRQILIGARVLNMHVSDPNCNNAHVTRNTDVTVRQNGNIIGKLNNFINPKNDTGKRVVEKMHTYTPIGCGVTEKVSFTTTSTTPELPGASGHGNQSFSFKTIC
jgi:hypothetical protein